MKEKYYCYYFPLAVCYYPWKLGKNPVFIHDLVRLAEKSDLILDDDQKDILDTISTFNIRGRYDDYKREFHEKCTTAFTKKWILNIKEFRAWIKTKLHK